ncbi:SpoIIE family protein phosphatase [Streptomyces marianii]|uniref:Protein phosphatase n=1 Tax=Streptomyces marianii TaxID=1817406 RepID=A0A5R9EJ97_9ACTN|nr:SpoIIE family protein phosphatase [Streptomyces marianii]TLQ48472.1 protein phosphatase [Streptomyces marianii]
MQQETAHRSVQLLPRRGGVRPAARTSLPGNPLAASAARRFVRAALADWTRLGTVTTRGTDRLADDAALVVSELATNAVIHAGTGVEVLARLDPATEDDPAALVIEVSDHHPARVVRGDGHEQEGTDPGEADHGRGLHLVAALAASWGITYRPGLKTVWARLPLDGFDGAAPARAGEAPRQRGVRAAEILAPSPRGSVRDDRQWVGRGALSFLAEASGLLAGQLDEDMVAALAGQLLVPRLADWCAVWLDGETGPAPRPARVWHADESVIEGLREALAGDPPRLPDEPRGTAVPVPVAWPPADAGSAVAFRLTVGARPLGTLLLGREAPPGVPDEALALLEDFARRVGLAIGAARQYTRQATISRVLQRGLLPAQVARIPGVDSSLVYEPSDEGLAGGDFYDIFPAGSGGRWCFMLGDVQGSGPEAAVVTGLARPWLRLLAREGYQVAGVLDRLNGLLLDDALEAAEAAALTAAGPAAAGPAGAGSGSGHEGPRSRFLSLLYGELTPLPEGGVRCALACAGHPLPLLLRPDGTVRPAAASQLLLGVVEDVAYESQTFELMPGDTLLCVTDGVTERRSGRRMFDDSDGLAQALAGCTGLTAEEVADRIRRAVHTFAEAPPDDDLALLVLQARRSPGR